MTYPLNTWIELPEERFKTYRTWRTPSGFLCGTYASSVLLAYYQDYLDETILPTRLRKKGSADNQALIKAMQPVLQPIDFPTVPVQISFGLNRFLNQQKTHKRTRFTSTGAWHRATKRILEGKPVMIGVLRLLGSTYGNHWVVAYGFYEDSHGQRLYKVHDNWGNYNKIIPARWANGTISFS
ncbi:hypothetical protein [Candidatus Enterococcus ferrettii]|uniref:Peptidase C39-like domain-containing protein n=1 Tax=Candidatus Enterococcus ferrettii TaxID=2815324 RepID=A0ABV0EXE6_9ENTE|nr:hypothetical protein [Enterococcus sp. 665A]MBO1338694.1 hypothetical protein [Enterococcus sp. 665A]